ncbi:MAG: AAA family ATPase [Deltaproteobacteria bacterium]|nr:AAA family ATPase [Deltaproteobacteria bacterium]
MSAYGVLGRTLELEALQAAIHRGARLLTLYGPAGVGKTALARTFAESQGRFPVVAVDLRPVASLAELHASVAEALNIPVDPAGDLNLALDERGPLLLLLDNFDALVEVGARSIEHWVEGRGLIVLITSREALGVEAEVAQLVSPLPEADAVELFLRGARRARPNFAEDDQVPGVVQALDRLPLAIELASAWCDGLTLAAIVAEVRSLSLLEPLSATLQASVERLPPEVRATLEGCAVFRGAFTLEDAQAVLGPHLPVARALAVLVKKCLLEVEFQATGARYDFLSVVRAFAEPEVPAELHARHARHFAGRSAASAAQLQDLLAAFEHASDANLRGRLALLLDPILYDRGPFDRHPVILDRALRDPGEGMEAALLHARARCSRVRGHTARAWQDLVRARAVATPEVLPRVLRMMGVIARHRESLELAEQLLHGAVSLARVAGDEDSVLRAADDLGIVLLDRGDFAGAEQQITLALDRARRLGDQRYQGIAQQHLGLRFHLEGALGQAEAHYGAALERLVSAGDRRFEGWTLGMSAYLALEDGRIDEAEARVDQALAIYRSIGDPRTRAFLLPPKVAVLVARGALAEAKAGLLSAYHGLDPEEDGGPRAALALLEAQLFGAGGAAPPPGGPIEVQVVARICRALGARRGVRVAADARWFEPAGRPRVSLARRPPLRRVLARLIRQHLEAPGRGLDWEALLEAGWPGERVMPGAGARRVYVAIATLRKMGLGSGISRADEGYTLDQRSLVLAEGDGSLTEV